MGGQWNLYGSQLHKVLCAFFMLQLLIGQCYSLNLEGLALLGFRRKVDVDRNGVFRNWDPRDRDPCNWLGVHCDNGKVDVLNLKELSLGGVLASDIGKLSHLRVLVLFNNNFSGTIPKEIGGLTMLEILDLRGNNLSGTIPTEIGEILSLKRLLLSDNKFEDCASFWTEKLNVLCDPKYDWNLSIDKAPTEVGVLSRKERHCFWQSGPKLLKLLNLIKGRFKHSLEWLPLFNFKRDHSDSKVRKHGDNLLADVSEPLIPQNEQYVISARRRLLESASNVPATSGNSGSPRDVVPVPSIGSGSFPAVGKKQSSTSTLPPSSQSSQTPNNQPSPTHASNSVSNQSSKGLQLWMYIMVVLVVALFVIGGAMFWTCRSHGAATIGPWKTGLSGQLQKAFVTGVPKLNRAELEAACEDFSNIISTHQDFVVFKGTLSSGVEIAVVSSAVPSAKDWTKLSEMYFRKKIDTISQVKHKNFINLLGYCQEDEPFMRMMVFEYAPNGTLFEHLHLKEFEHLDWTVRMRIIMGMSYCLHHMHHELNPPVAHPDLQSSNIFITDDYAAKIADMSIWKEMISNGKIFEDDEMDLAQLPNAAPENDVYNFGILLLEILSGKIRQSEEHGSFLSWAIECLTDKSTYGSLTDPALKSVNDNELEAVCAVIRDCLNQDPKRRPSMKDVTLRLREVIAISPEAATPRLSPLWWAELEILSVEAS